MESTFLRVKRLILQTRMASYGGSFVLARAIIALKAGRLTERPLSASSTYSLITRCPCFEAYSLSARSWADKDRSTSCASDDTLAYKATFILIPLHKTFYRLKRTISTSSGNNPSHDND